MEKLIFLGTGHAMVYDCFNTCFVIDDPEGNVVLVDTGGGIQILRQLRDVGISLNRIHDIFISHQHIDHLLGLFWILRAMDRIVSKDDYEGILTIYMHEELEKVARTAVTAVMPRLRELDRKVIYRVVEPGQEGVLGDHPVTFFDTFSDEERQFGFRMTLKNGQSLLFNGDVPLRKENYPLAQGVDWLLHEAFDLEEVMARQGRGGWKHSSVRLAASIAEEVGAKNLVLYHGTDKYLAERKGKYIEEARSVFNGLVYAPDDLDIIKLA